MRENWKRRQSIQLPGAQPLPSPTSQIQTPSFESVSSSHIFLNTQLVSPSVSTSESFALFKEKRSSEKQKRNQSNKDELTENMGDITHSKFSQMLVTSPGNKSPTRESRLSYSDNNYSYFPPIYESSDQNSPPRSNISS